MSAIQDHPLRYELANELHARPFPSLDAPGRVAYLAFTQNTEGGDHSRLNARDQLIALLDRFGETHPQPDATHYFGALGRHQLKWEQHTEFVTYSLFSTGGAERPFDPAEFEAFPEDWLQSVTAERITSINLRVETRISDDEISQSLAEWFVPESLTVSEVLDKSAVVAGDFRVDASGHQRFALFVAAETGPRRIGRVIQRICEIETYKSMSMLGFSTARSISPRMAQIDAELSELMADMTQAQKSPERTLDALLKISAELENLSAQVAFRFGATGAYEAIVNQRIQVLREERFTGRQTFGEFMMRRYDPAMRTVKASERRLSAMADRAMRAGNLLRTRVDVERSAQNQSLLESMNARADLQLRLQKTVEGLSVVAISYYAVSLAGYLMSPLASPLATSTNSLKATVTLPVVLLVWWAIRRIRKRIE